MATSPPCKAYHFPGGVTNGAEWYVLEGGMQDFNYHFSNCVEITLELSCCKHPPASQLPREWEHNREALLSYLEAAQTGVRGVVTSRGRALGGATVEVAGIEKHVQTTERGEYWRLLAPGSYRCLGFIYWYHPHKTNQSIQCSSCQWTIGLRLETSDCG